MISGEEEKIEELQAHERSRKRAVLDQMDRRKASVEGWEESIRTGYLL